MPVAEALPIARQIAEALEAAHEKGIIHRDLKPANIKITPDGAVKVLDFGLAKAITGDASGSDLSQSPTITLDGTREGVILGTAAYMSPEQARGQPVDKRTDIWAFGCVLYEMLTGRRAFPGDDVSDTLAAILRGEPDWTALPASTPAAVRKLLRGCLEKDRRERLPDIGVARLEIKETLTAPLTEAVALAPVPRLRVWQRPAPLAAGIVTLIAATGLASWFLTRSAPPRVVAPGGDPVRRDRPRHRWHSVLSSRSRLTARASRTSAPVPSRSSCARSISSSPRRSRVWARRAASSSRPTANGSASSMETGALKKVAGTGGPPVTVSRTSGTPRGASWSTDDTIIFATDDPTSGLLRVAAGGGEPEVLTTPNRDQGELDHLLARGLARWPGRALHHHDGWRSRTTAQIAVLDLTTREQKILIRGGSHARYVPTGHLVYGVARDVAGGRLRPQTARGRGHTGAGVGASDDHADAGAVNMSISDDGTLVYVPAGCRNGALHVGVGGSAGTRGAAQGAAAGLPVPAPVARWHAGGARRARRGVRTSGSGTSRARR